MSIEDKNIPKSKEVENLEQKLKENNEAISAMESAEKAKDKKMLTISIKLGSSDAELIESGYTQEEIYEARGKSGSPDTKSPIVSEGENTNEKNKKEIGKQDKIDAIFEELISNTKYIEDQEKKLSELIELREKLTIEENSRKNIVTQESNEDKSVSKGVDDITHGVDVNKNEHLDNLQKLRNAVYKNKESIKVLSNKIDSLNESIDKEKLWKPWRYPSILSKEWKKWRLKKERDLLQLDNIMLEEGFEHEESKEFPLAYYVVNKIKTPKVRDFFTGYGLNAKNMTERPYISMHVINNIDSINTPIADPMERSEFGPLRPRITNDNIVHLNIYGFSIRMVNRNEVDIDRDDNFDISSPKPKYNVLDQNGNKVADNVDYISATRIYEEATEKYSKDVEEEFNNSKTNNK